MKNSNQNRPTACFPSEKTSQKLLIEKMGLSTEEFSEITNHYGVSASKILEIMQLSKYQFVFAGKTPGQCEPCHHLVQGRMFNY